MKIQKGDTVIVLKGRDKKKVGEVLSLMHAEDRVVVAGINIRTRNVKPKTQGEKGYTEKKEMPIAVSNIALVDPKDKKPTRVGYTGAGKEKNRVARRSGAVLKKTTVRKKTDVKESATKTAAKTAPTATTKKDE